MEFIFQSSCEFIGPSLYLAWTISSLNAREGVSRKCRDALAYRGTVGLSWAAWEPPSAGTLWISQSFELTSMLQDIPFPLKPHWTRLGLSGGLLNQLFKLSPTSFLQALDAQESLGYHPQDRHRSWCSVQSPESWGCLKMPTFRMCLGGKQGTRDNNLAEMVT